MQRYISLAILWSLVFAGVGTADDIYYVDSVNGDNDDDGSISSPFETIQYAIDQSEEGYTVRVKRGTVYTEEVLIDGFNGTSSNVFTLETYGSGNNPIIRASTNDVVTLYVKNSDYVYIDDFDLDGDSKGEKGLIIEDSDHVYPYDVDVDDYEEKGVVIKDSDYCTLTYCDVTNTDDNGPAAKDGTGVFIRDDSDHIKLDNCIITDNDLDGIGCNAGTDRITDVDIYYCTVEDNGRQGIRTQEVDDVDITGGTFNHNCASGIQIEADTTDVLIDGVTANDNSVTCSGEAGIWIHEATEVIIVDCTTRLNPWNILVSQSDDVTIEDCLVKDATKKNFVGKAGLRIVTGRNYYDFSSGSPPYTPVNPSASWYSSMPKGGVRDLTIKNCTFDGNTGDGGKNIIYGDDLNDEDDADFMQYTNNKLIGTFPSTNEIRDFDLGGGVDGYGTNLEVLQDNP